MPPTCALCDFTLSGEPTGCYQYRAPGDGRAHQRRDGAFCSYGASMPRRRRTRCSVERGATERRSRRPWQFRHLNSVCIATAFHRRELKHVGALLAMPEGLSVGESRPVSLLPLAGHEDNNGHAQTPAHERHWHHRTNTRLMRAVGATLISIPGTTSSAKDEESVAATSEYPSPSATPPRAQSPMRRPPEAPEQESTSNNTASVAVRTSLHEKLLAADSRNDDGAKAPPGSSDAPSSVSLQGAAFGPHASTVLPRPVHKVDKATAGATASQGSSTVIVPRQLEVSVEHAFGAVKAGGQVRPSSVTLPTAFRNAQRAQSLDEQAADGKRDISHQIGRRSFPMRACAARPGTHP